MHWINEKSQFYASLAIRKPLICVDYHKLWNVLRTVAIPEHLIIFMRNLYAIRYRWQNNWQIAKGVRPGYYLTDTWNTY